MQNIEGVPVGTRIKNVKLSWNAITSVNVASVTLEPDNVYGVLDLDTVKIPEGYKRVEKDWFREPWLDEFFVSGMDGSAATMTYRGGYERRPRIILEPIKRTRTVAILEYEVVEGAPIDRSTQVSRHTAKLWVNSPNMNARIEERPI